MWCFRRVSCCCSVKGRARGFVGGGRRPTRSGQPDDVDEALHVPAELAHRPVTDDLVVGLLEAVLLDVAAADVEEALLDVPPHLVLLCGARPERVAAGMGEADCGSVCGGGAWRGGGESRLYEAPRAGSRRILSHFRLCIRTSNAVVV